MAQRLFVSYVHNFHSSVNSPVSTPGSIVLDEEFLVVASEEGIRVLVELIRSAHSWTDAVGVTIVSWQRME